MRLPRSRPRRGSRPSVFAERQAREAQHVDALLDGLLSSGSPCVDVGAHTGEFLDRLLQRAPSGGHTAFEPLPLLAERLRERYPSVRVQWCALGEDEGGEATLFHQVDAPAWSSLAAAHAPMGGSRVEPIRVPLRRLDAVVEEADLVKVDVEGAELGVLRGASGLVERSAPVILFEHAHIHARHFKTSPSNVWDLLAGYGMRVYSLDGRGPHSREAFTGICETARRLEYGLDAETNFVARTAG